MVVFTCNNCGDSLQKPKVEKHYSTVCRTFKNLTCVDCLKDFKEEDYVGHIKCVSEKERYAAKGSVVNVVNKGEAKQQQWSDMIMEIINNKTDVTPSQKLVFDIMSNLIINVPRKKLKFMNFIKNAGGNKIMYADIESVWDIIEEYKSSQKKQDITTVEEPTLNQNEPADASSKPKKRKSKNAEPTSEKETPDLLEENEVKPKKKKSKKGKIVDQEDIVDPATPSTEKPVEETLKTKSKKRKSESLEHNNVEAAVTDSMNENEKSQKKRKSKSLQKNETTNDGCLEEEDEKTTQNDNGKDAEQGNESLIENGKKKKKRKSADKLNGVCHENLNQEKLKENEVSNGDASIKSIEEANASQENNKISNGTESLTDKILRLLKKKGSFSISKLQKKVLKEYHQETGAEASPKLVKKFNKLLKKIDGIEVSEDNVRLLQV